MSNEIFRLTLFVMALISITSCKTEKKYYYVENGREEKTINAHSDSAAYMDAFADFQISKNQLVLLY